MLQLFEMLLACFFAGGLCARLRGGLFFRLDLRLLIALAIAFAHIHLGACLLDTFLLGVPLLLFCAEELLQSGEFTVLEAALLTGFDDPGYFSRLFKKEFGIRPSEYLPR